MLLETDVQVALISAATTVVGAILAYLGVRRKVEHARAERDQAVHEINAEHEALDFSAFVGDYKETERHIISLFDDTNVDRFLLLTAYNGYMRPKWASATVQLRKKD